jgi:hypothetical protein
MKMNMNELPKAGIDSANPILFIAFSSSFDILNYSLKRCPHVNFLFLPQLKEEFVYYTEIRYISGIINLRKCNV